MKYFISVANIEWSKDRWVQKGLGFLPFCPYPEKKGKIALFDRNTEKFYWFTIIKKATDRLGYIVERGSVPRYWKDSIKAEA